MAGKTAWKTISSCSCTHAGKANATESRATGACNKLFSHFSPASSPAEAMHRSRFVTGWSIRLPTRAFVEQFVWDGCLKSETDFAARLARVWAKAPAADPASCETVLAASQPSNQRVAGCIGVGDGTEFLEWRFALEGAVLTPIKCVPVRYRRGVDGGEPID
jgi:hypothetical protein